MKTCPTLITSLDWCYGTPNLPGVQSRVYAISKGDIVSYPTLKRDELGRVISSELEGDFVLAADKVWAHMDILPDKSQLTSEPQGEIPSQSQLNKLVALHPGTGPEATQLAAAVNNSNCIFIVRDMNNRYRVVGNEKYVAKATVNQDLGQGTTGTASTTLNVEVTDEVPAPFYYGKIETADGEIDCSTGKPVED